MSTNAAPADAIPLRCGVCGKHLCWADGRYVQAAPCSCGWQTTVEAVGRRAQQSVTLAGEQIEVKSRR